MRLSYGAQVGSEGVPLLQRVSKLRLEEGHLSGQRGVLLAEEEDSSVRVGVRAGGGGGKAYGDRNRVRALVPLPLENKKEVNDNGSSDWIWMCTLLQLGALTINFVSTMFKPSPE